MESTDKKGGGMLALPKPKKSGVTSQGSVFSFNPDQVAQGVIQQKRTLQPRAD
jgi:hypothetical protein